RSSRGRRSPRRSCRGGRAGRDPRADAAPPGRGAGPAARHARPPPARPVGAASHAAGADVAGPRGARTTCGPLSPRARPRASAPERRRPAAPGTCGRMSAPLIRLLRHSHPHRRRIAAASAASIANKLFDLAPPALIGLAVDTVVEGGDSTLAGLGVERPETQLAWLAVLTVVIWGLESAFEYLQKWLWRNLAQTLQHELRVEAFEHLQTLDAAWFQEARTGGLLAIVNDDVNQLERFLDGGADDLLQTATTMVLVSAVFFWLSPA